MTQPTLPAPPPVEDELDSFLRVYADRPIPPGPLLEIIRKEAGLDEEDMEGIPLHDRFDAGGGVRWNVLESPPGGMLDNFIIIAIFTGDQTDKQDDHVPGEARVYVASRDVPPKASNEEGVWYRARAFMRYRLSRVPGSGLTREVMTARQFIDEASTELNELAVVFDVLEETSDEDDKPGN
jgi:hypothetical protein